MSRYTINRGNCLDVLPQLRQGSVNTVVTSPPYFRLRDYFAEGQLGQEKSVAEFVAQLVAIFRQVRRVLRPDGTLWLNLADSYCRSDNKRRLLKKGDMLGVPWEVALALREDGWFLRSSIIWNRTNPCPESVQDRPSRAHEYIFLLSANRRYYYDAAAIREPVSESTLRRHRTEQKRAESPREAVYKSHSLINGVNPKYRRKSVEEIQARGRNRRNVWTTACATNRNAVHHATYPEQLITPCVLAGSPVGGVVLDPFAGTGTTGAAALRHGRDFVGIELNAEYAAIAEERLSRLA